MEARFLVLRPEQGTRLIMSPPCPRTRTSRPDLGERPSGVPVPCVHPFRAVAWALRTTQGRDGLLIPCLRRQAGGAAASREMERLLWEDPSLLNTAGLDRGNPGDLCFISRGGHFLVSGLTLHTDPAALLKSVLESIAYCWSTFLETAAGRKPGRIEGLGWIFGSDDFCAFLAESTEIPVLSGVSGGIFRPTAGSPEFVRARRRWSDLNREMAGAFPILADIEKKTLKR